MWLHELKNRILLCACSFLDLKINIFPRTTYYFNLRPKLCRLQYSYLRGQCVVTDFYLVVTVAQDGIRVIIYVHLKYEYTREVHVHIHERNMICVYRGSLL